MSEIASISIMPTMRKPRAFRKRRDKNLYYSPVTGEPHCVADVAVFLDMPKSTPYRWMQQGDLPM